MSSTLNNDELDYFNENIKSTQPSNSTLPTNEVNDLKVESQPASTKDKVKTSYKGIVNLVVIGLGTSLGAYFGYGLIADQSLNNLTEEVSVNQVVVDSEATGSSANKASSLLDNAVAQASVYFANKNTFKGFKSGNSVKVASNDESIVVVVVVNEQCYSNGITSGYDSVTRFDPTGKRCSAKKLKSLQKLMRK